MIHHVVLCRFKEGTSAEAIARAGAALLGLKDVIPEIRAIAFGPNLAPDASEWTHGLLVLCEDMAAVQRYLDHPAHLEAVRSWLLPIRDGRIAADLQL